MSARKNELSIFLVLLQKNKLSGFLFLLLMAGMFGVSAAPTLSGLNGTHRTYSAKSLGHLRLTVGLSGEGSQDENKVLNGNFYHWNYAYDSTAVENGQVNYIRVDEKNDSTHITELLDLSFRLFMGIGLSDYFDVGVAMPFHYDNITKVDAESHPDLENVSGFGLGDIEILGKLQYPPYAHDSTWEMALMGIVTLPTGDKTKGFVPKEAFYIPKDSTKETRFWSAQLPSVTLLWLNTFDVKQLNQNIPLEWNFNLGMQVTASELLDNSLLLSSSLVFTPVPLVSFFLEFSGQTRMSNFEGGFYLGDDPLLISPGAILNTPNGMTFSLALDKSLSASGTREQLKIDSDPGPRENDPLCKNCTGDGVYTTYSTRPAANLGVSAVLAWTGYIIPQDRDGDGIVDEDDACPAEPEDIDRFEDNDGCPEVDNDQDGVLDVNDKCPMEAEDRDGFEDADGCPDLDNDKDGIPDEKDKCINLPEDMNGMEDEDGCPDGMRDTDQDGIPDVRDKCPKSPEDIDLFQDEDGCPENDNDNDGILDISDRCPNKPETVNGFEDADGCPDVKPQPKKKVIEKQARIVLHGVTFATGSADLTDDSFPKLREVAETLKDNPEVVIEIRGYTDNRGSRRLNERLSNDRARSVVEYLVAQGVKPSQLRYKGLGPENPIATNRTAAGRAQNRRIEMYRVK